MLDGALDSVADQLDDDALRARVQVCISDNGSRDETQAVIADRRELLGAALVDQRFDGDRGFTANLLQAVALASGDFCWLLGSDDTLEPGALHAVKQAIGLRRRAARRRRSAAQAPAP